MRRCKFCGHPVNKYEKTGPSWNEWFHLDVPNEGSAWCKDNKQMADVLPEHEYITEILSHYEM